jgi:hypothetical protein
MSEGESTTTAKREYISIVNKDISLIKRHIRKNVKPGEV